MENSTVTGLRSRSRSKTPFLRSNGDYENWDGQHEDHILVKSGRKTPVKRSTPIKQMKESSTVIEEYESNGSSVAQRTRQSVRVTHQTIKTSDYSSEESLDRLKGNQRETQQSEVNGGDDARVSSSARRAASLVDLTLSPISSTRRASADRSGRWGSPAYSACSTDSSFAEQALADASALLERDPARDHLPSRLYRLAGEYWNKYPKTDYTYSRLSKDRVELAPGQVAVPNMSRRSLAHFRVHGALTSADEVDLSRSAASARYKDIDTSDDESAYITSTYHRRHERWLITSLIITVITFITTITRRAYNTLTGHRGRQTYAYPHRNSGSSVWSSVLAPVYWVHTFVKTTTTTIITKITKHSTHNSRTVKNNTVIENRRRWWPWMLLVLVPLLGYGCYSYMNTKEIQDFMFYKYQSPAVPDSDLKARVAALEKWASNLDTTMKDVNEHLTILNDLDSKIEGHVQKHFNQNLLTIINMVSNSEVVMDRFKTYFDKFYVAQDQMVEMGQSLRESLSSTQGSHFDEEKMQEIIHNYLSSYERRQTMIMLEKMKEYVKEIEVQKVEMGFDVEAVKKLVAEMLQVYDADKTGMVDYALESAGGQVISTRCTELYQVKTKQYSVLGVFRWWVYSTPRQALTPGALPGDCWAFQGFPGYLVIRTFAIIEVTGFSLEHMSRLLAVDGVIDSAPRNFSVYGLHGELDPEPHLFGDYIYDANGTSIQYFPVKYPKTTNIAGKEYPVAYDMMELRVESNHGDPTYTCLYRFRVHGNPLKDIRKATDDTIKESESR